MGGFDCSERSTPARIFSSAPREATLSLSGGVPSGQAHFNLVTGSPRLARLRDLRRSRDTQVFRRLSLATGAGALRRYSSDFPAPGSWELDAMGADAPFALLPVATLGPIAFRLAAPAPDAWAGQAIL